MASAVAFGDRVLRERSRLFSPPTSAIGDEQNRSRWRLSQPLASAGYLLSLDDYTIDSPDRRCVPTHVECVIDKENSFAKALVHFPHAAEAQLACWSLFRQHPALTPRFSLASGIKFGDSAWTIGLMRLINASVAPRGRKRSADCAVRGRLRRLRTGWTGSEQAWLVGRADATELQNRLFGGQALTGGPKAERPTVAGLPVRVGLVNRKGSRRIVDADKAMAALARALAAREIATLSYMSDLGDLGFEEQAQWVHAQDILLSPHGAQNVNFLWARPCTAIVEFFPKHYFIPGEYLQLARAVGAVAFAAYKGPVDPYADTALALGEGRRAYGYRRRARYGQLSLGWNGGWNGSFTDAMLKGLLEARAACLATHGANDSSWARHDLGQPTQQRHLMPHLSTFRTLPQQGMPRTHQLRDEIFG